MLHRLARVRMIASGCWGWTDYGRRCQFLSARAGDCLLLYEGLATLSSFVERSFVAWVVCLRYVVGGGNGLGTKVIERSRSQEGLKILSEVGC